MYCIQNNKYRTTILLSWLSRLLNKDFYHSNFPEENGFVSQGAQFGITETTMHSESEVYDTMVVQAEDCRSSPGPRSRFMLSTKEQLPFFMYTPAF